MEGRSSQCVQLGEWLGSHFVEKRSEQQLLQRSPERSCSKVRHDEELWRTQDVRLSHVVAIRLYGLH